MIYKVKTLADLWRNKYSRENSSSWSQILTSLSFNSQSPHCFIQMQNVKQYYFKIVLFYFQSKQIIIQKYIIIQKHIVIQRHIKNYTMRKNASLSQLNGLSVTSYSMQSPLNQQKKLQGFDLASASKSTTFTKKIEQLKNKPTKQTIEDQYIKGLQDEIHYLQMELKLLQQKDQAKHGQIDQLQKFFSDGVPINENILAIKNGFNNYKNSKEKTIKQLTGQKQQRQALTHELSGRIKQMQKQLQKQQKDIRVFQTARTSQLHLQVKSQAKIKKQIQLEDEQLKSLKLKNRKLSEKLTSLQRNKQIQMIMALKSQSHKMDKLSKIKESIIQKEAQNEELEKQYEQLLKQEQEKSYVIKIQQQNLNLKKKAISMDRQLNALQTKAQQKQMELEARLKERHKQICAKSDMKTRVEGQKSKISKQNSMKVQDIEKVARQKQISLLQKIISQNKKLSKYTQYYGQILSKVQEQIQSMVQKRPQLKSEMNGYQGEVKRLVQRVQEQKSRQCQLYSQIIQADTKTQHFLSVTPPLVQRIQKSEQQIRIYTNQRQKLLVDIKVKEKQLDLILILKSLNIEEVEMSKSSSSNIQDKLIGFIRSWEQLQRNA